MSRRSRQEAPEGGLPLLGGLADLDEPAGEVPGPDVEEAAEQPSGSSAAGPPTRSRRRGHPVRTAVVLVLTVGLVGAAGVAGWNFVRPIVADLTADTDYPGPGSGEVTVQVPDGATGTDIAQELAEADVVMTPDAFVQAVAADPDAASIQPGTYQLRQQMSAAGALDALLDPSAKVSNRVQLIEGLRAEAALGQISDATGISVDDLEAAATDPAVGLPAEADGRLEGYLFPATYEFDPGATAVDVVGAMVARTEQALTDAGVPQERWHRTLTLASIVEAEASRDEDRPKVARVLENRLAIDMPLQLDTTVDYANNTRGLTTSDEQRASQSPYNTYVHPGLPPGPIDSPGESAIDAAASPADGSWLYFVAVNPDTGETKFATTFAEHQENVREWQEWLRTHDEDG